MAETADTPELADIEVQALESGWQPEEEFKSDPKNAGKKWRPAEEFMDRKSLFDKIEDQHKQIRDLKKGVDALTKHNKIIEDSTYERARRELREERKTALAEGDLVKAEELRDRIDEIKEKQQIAQQSAPSANPEHPEYTQFKQANPWYEKDVKMTAWADGMGALLARQGKSPSEVLVEINKLSREEFPEKFNKRNPNKDDAPSVGSGRQSRSSPDTFRLTEEEERVMKRMIRAGAKIDEKEYKEQIKRSKGL